MMREDTSSLDMIRNNAKTIGGIVGAEQAWLDEHKDEDESFFMDRSIMDLQDVTFNQIEKTNLGKTLKNQLNKLEERAKYLSGNIADMKASQKAKEAAIWSKAEETMHNRFQEK